MGRFITTDPVKGDQMNPQTFNPYVYCLNNPLKYVDPDGRDSMIHPQYNWPDEPVSEGHWWGGLIMV
ncbi:MAG: RHS repeat-associated core domain-containing protein, partial [Euryarchaeota archaeon]|nr:RHS repeat-associated core domain-containing protein [Euryarchaeota archaeon]